MDDLASGPGVEELVVDVAVRLELPVGRGARGEPLRTEPVPHHAEVLLGVGEGQPIVDPRVAFVVANEDLDDGGSGHPEVDLDHAGVERIGEDPALAAHEAERRQVDVLGARHHTVANVEGERGRRGVGVQTDYLGIEPEVVVALYAAGAVARVAVEQVERALPGELAVRADAVVALAPAVPGRLLADPLVLLAVRDRLLGLDADAVEAQTGSRTLLVGRADAVVVVDDHLGAAGQADEDEGGDQEFAHLSVSLFT